MKRWVRALSRRALAIVIAVVVFSMGLPGAKAFGTDQTPSVANPPKVNACPEVTYTGPYINGNQELGSYDLLVKWYTDLVTKYPSYMKIFQPNVKYGLGQIASSSSHAPYDLNYVLITNLSTGLHKPEVFWMGNPHGDESVGPIGAYWFADWLMRYAFDPACQTDISAWLRWLIDNREIYIGATHNPDGWDNDRRENADGADINREADFQCCSQSSYPDPFHTVNGKTSSKFIDSHQIRTGQDPHGGAVMGLYPWGVIGDNVQGTSRISGTSYSNAPPDFYFYDAETLRMGKYMGSYQGGYDSSNTGPPAAILYHAYGTYLDFGYGANIGAHPEMASNVKNGPYVGPTIMWWSFEHNQMPKTRPSSQFGTDLKDGWGIKVRRELLSMIDFAQPYSQWWPGTPANNSQVDSGVPIDFKWVVNGSLVVDNTRVQWATNPADAINNPSGTMPDHTDFQGKDQGGTGWDSASAGKTNPYIWTDKITFQSQGDYYVVARAKVDQVYKNILRPDIYTSGSYLRIVNERTKTGWSETINGDDGTETMAYHEWWYSPILHVTAGTSSVPPTVTSTSPTNGATGVPPNSKISVTFSKAMNQASATGAFSAVPTINGSWAWNTQGTTMTITPSPQMQTNTTYNVKISTAAKDLAGNAMVADYLFSFKTSQQADTTPPTVKSTVPTNGATGVSTKTTISIEFSEPMDKTTAESSYTINPTDGGHTITWTGDTMVVAPASELKPLTQYTVKIAKSASDIAGNPMTADYTFSFTTADKSSDTTPPAVNSTDPVDLETNVATNKQITIFFSEAMKKPDTEGSFQISPNVTGTFNWGKDSDMTFAPSPDMQPNTKYDVTLSTNAMDLAGNKMSTGYSFSFTTGSGPDTTPPTVIDTIPLDGAGGVPPDIVVNIKFSELMSQQSVQSSLSWAPPAIKGLGFGWSGETLFIEPNEVDVGVPGLKENTKYTLTISTGAKDRVGLGLQSPFTMSFTTRMQTPPTVMYNVPGDGEDNVQQNIAIKVKFSKPMDAIAAKTAWSIEPSIAGTFTFQENGSLLVFKPSSNLAKATQYTVQIDKTARDTSGNYLKYAWTFSFYTIGYKPSVGGSGTDFISSPTFLALIIAVVAVVVLVIVLLAYRGRKKKKEFEMALQQQYYMQDGYYGQGGYYNQPQGEGPPPPNW
jgi:hypothetical protein